jgi:hypothetical protein
MITGLFILALSAGISCQLYIFSVLSLRDRNISPFVFRRNRLL